MPNQSMAISADDGPHVHSVTCCVVRKPSSSVSESVLVAADQSKNLKYGEWSWSPERS